MKNKILIVDDEADLCELLQDTLTRGGYLVDICFNITQAKRKLELSGYDLVLTDLNLHGEIGMSLVTHVVKNYSGTPIAIMTAYGTHDLSVEALRLGAFDVISKPIDNEFLFTLVQDAINGGQSNVKNKADEVLSVLIGDSHPMQRLKSRLMKVSAGQAPVFIHGESGTGKEVVANLIHRLSGRSSGPFVAINCSAIPEELLESELFGHKKGIFTGAVSDKLGLIQNANGGTLFLDEIAELPLRMQAKILRAVQEKKVRQLGSDVEAFVDFRIISATHQNIESMIEQKLFRQDLYFRLHVMDVSVPPLRERGDDILLLANYFAEQIGSENRGVIKGFTAEANAWLLKQPYHGNVRELQNLILRAYTLSEGSAITVEDLLDDQSDGSWQVKVEIGNGAVGIDVGGLQGAELLNQILPAVVSNGLANLIAGAEVGATANLLEGGAQAGEVYIPKNEGLEAYLDGVEMAILSATLREAHGSINVCAKMLKLSSRSLRYRLKKFNIQFEDEPG